MYGHEFLKLNCNVFDQSLERISYIYVNTFYKTTEKLQSMFLPCGMWKMPCFMNSFCTLPMKIT